MPADLPQSPYFPRATRMAAKLAAAGHSFTPESLCDLFRRTFDLEDLRVAAALRQPPERIEPWIVAVAGADSDQLAGNGNYQIARSFPDACAYLVSELAEIRLQVARIEVEDERVSVVGPRGLLAEIRRPLSVAVDDDRIQEASRVLEGVAVFSGDVVLAKRLKQFLPWFKDAQVVDLQEPDRADGAAESASPKDPVARVDHLARRMQHAFAIRGTRIRKTLAYELLALAFEFEDWNHLSAAYRRNPHAGRTPHLIIDQRRDMFWYAPTVESALAFARQLPPVTAEVGARWGCVSVGLSYRPLCELRSGHPEEMPRAPLIYSVLNLPLQSGMADLVQLLTHRGADVANVVAAARQVLGIGGTKEDRDQAYSLLRNELYVVERKGYRFSLQDTGQELHLRVIASSRPDRAPRPNQASVRLDAVHFKPAELSDDGLPWLCKYDEAQKYMALPGLSDADLNYLYWEFAVDYYRQPQLERALGPSLCRDIVQAWVADGGTVDEFALQRPWA